MCSYPHLQYHFDQYELDCRHRDTPQEVHEQRFAGSSFADHLLQSNTNSQALPLANAQSRALSLLPGATQRYQLEAAFLWFSLSLTNHTNQQPAIDSQLGLGILRSRDQTSRTCDLQFQFLELLTL